VVSALLICGILSAVVYAATDIVAGSLYPGFSLADQAVSELFAIGAPTAGLVVPLFSLSSALLAAFALGVWRSSAHQWPLRMMSWMFFGSALIGLTLWNLFPMHMRGAGRTFTDTMHLILAANPFVLLTLAFGLAAFRLRFRLFTVGTILVVTLPAVFAFHYAPEIDRHQPTPWLGLAERLAQDGYLLWQVALASLLLRARRLADR
jgi:Protein of unknown function (DUF998)